MERYIAIDNVCAWPNVNLLPDGSLAAVIFNQPVHGRWAGDVECWVSEDGGIAWRRRGTPAPHEPGTNRMNVAAGLAANGDLLVISSGWSNRPPAGEIRNFEAAVTLTPWVCRSADGGRAWQRAETFPAPPGMTGQPIPFGKIVRLENGELGACAYGERMVFFYRSADDGLTWGAPALIGAGDYNETCPLALPDGRLLAAARTYGDRHLDLMVSADGGRNWVCRGPLTLAGQHPSDLLALADGRILLAYGIRNPGQRAIAARLSADGGETWSAPRLLLDNGHQDVDFGYPSSAQLPDGTIVTAYYAASTPAHNRYHMGVLRWRADEA